MIELTHSLVDRALPKIAVGLRKYEWLQKTLFGTNVVNDRQFQRRFNGFYRVRRGSDWQRAFYEMLEREKSRPRPFAAILQELCDRTGRIEASYASKLLATIDPRNPVIDAIVLANVGLRLRTRGPLHERWAAAVAVHHELGRLFAEWLTTESGRYLVAQFGAYYPEVQVTPVKMLDLVLWQTRT